MAVTQLRVLGGAVARVPSEATAYAHRDSRIMVNVAAIYGAPGERPEHEAWVADLARELDDGDTAAYVGFLADEGRGAHPRRLPRDHLRPAGRRQGALRPGQRLPPQPERPADGGGPGRLS